jgi:DNA-binding MarR family transcriptional regulator
METDKQQLNRHILRIVEEIYKMIGPAVPDEWLSSDLTVTQFRLLLVLHTFGPLRMSDIAARLKVTLPTTTIIVDNLVRKNLVQREANPQDRRLVICILSPEGQALINKLWGSGQMIIEKLLEGLTAAQMQKATEVADLLYQNALKIARTNQPFTDGSGD